MKLPHQVLGAAFGRVRAPGARTAAPKVKNCRTGATMSHMYAYKRKCLHAFNYGFGACLTRKAVDVACIARDHRRCPAHRQQENRHNPVVATV